MKKGEKLKKLLKPRKMQQKKSKNNLKSYIKIALENMLSYA
jgi:hypothetical protein